MLNEQIHFHEILSGLNINNSYSKSLIKLLECSESIISIYIGVTFNISRECDISIALNKSRADIVKLSNNKKDKPSNEGKSTLNLFKYYPESKSLEEKETRFLLIQPVSQLNYSLFFKKNEIDILDIQLIESLGIIRHISCIISNTSPSSKLRVKLRPEQLTQILFSLGWDGDFELLSHAFCTIEQINPSLLNDCLFADILFSNGEIDSKISLYLCDENYPTLKDNLVCRAFPQLISEFASEYNQKENLNNTLNEHADSITSCDFKITINTQIEAKAYICF